MKAATTSLPVLFALGLASTAFAQGAPPPAPTYYAPGGAPAPGPAAPAAAPAPGPAAAPGAPAPGPAAPAPAPAAGAGWSFAGGFDSSAPAAAPTDAPATSDEERLEQRKLSLQLNNTLYGSTGLLRLSEAGSGAPGTFRVSLLTDWYSGSGFLCQGDFKCPTLKNGTGDEASHFGATAAVSITPFKFMEAFASIRSYANSNDAGKPKLLQVLGDTVLGAKVFTPAAPGKTFRFGGEAQLLLVNGTGGVGLNGDGTGLRIRGLATADLQKPGGRGAPLRIHANVGYHVDNTGKVVESTEKNRGGVPITRIERYGLGINRTDSVEWGVGVEGVFKKVRPFLAYTMDLPVNRQGYTCKDFAATTKAFGDKCLGNDPGMSYFPSRLTLGARAFPWKGLAPMAALDIGVTGTSKFMEEVSPQAPWTLYFGLGYAVDVEEAQTIVKTQTVEKVVQTPPPPQYVVRGMVHETGQPTAVVDAIVKVSGRNGGFTTGGDGKFETNNVEPGNYVFNIKADGYKEGSCTATVTAVGAPPAAPPGAAPGAPPAAPPPAAAPGGPVVNYVDVDCPLEALPKSGNIVGQVVDAESKTPITGATVIAIVDGKEQRATTDSSGSFSFQSVRPGAVQLKVEADKFFAGGDSVTVKPRADAKPQIGLSARPKNASVVIAGKEIVIKKQIMFETDSSVIKGESNSLMAEIADVIQRNPTIKRIEIQGHTDNTGTPDHNMSLSDSRANAVKSGLVSRGVDAGRLDAKGYGATRPRVPNVTAANRAMNRRVQFVIVERDK